MFVKIGDDMKFYGREKELAELKRIREISYETSQFTVVTGRRRVGKTELVEKAFNDGKTPYLYLFVSSRAEKDLCSIFQEEIQNVISQPILGRAERIGQLLEIVMSYSQTTPMTLVIDEFQEFDKINAAIFGEIQAVWDRYHKKSKLNLVVCGSVNRLMTKIFFDDSQPLYGRNTAKLHLDSFPIETIKQVLKDYNKKSTKQDLLALWTLTGGVARYVELFMDSKAVTRLDMIKNVCSLSSSYIDEGRVILSDEFGKEYGTYFSILSAIASGKASFSEIKNIIGAEIGGHLTKLESTYGYIAKTQPIFEGSSNRNCHYRIDDCFFRFWFRFIYKYLHLIEQKQIAQLQRVIVRDFDVFSGWSLEQYFRRKFVEEGKYTRIGGWWDRKGENEIDIVCENEFDGVLDFYEVKLSSNRYDESLLQQKAVAFFTKHPDKSSMKINFAGLSLNDM
jgi:AAA+ ATPase superfamily predicted ATPase